MAGLNSPNAHIPFNFLFLSFFLGGGGNRASCKLNIRSTIKSHPVLHIPLS